ncbi:MAG: glycosyltransferase [Chthoniobacteraceae bacterium]|nr:glycosyltransferase [Chthoniobacteraceae bacterium]
MKTVSILLPTRNRADCLPQTFQCLASAVVPRGMEAELLLVDNGSTDATPALLAACRLPQMDVRVLHEPLPGRARACNAAIAAARGDILLFTDDDVHISCDWIGKMSAPLFRHEADAVSGAVRLPPHLLLPWMDEYHRGWLGSSEGFSETKVDHMLGGNMACVRRVFEKVPGFDTDLGAGMLGYHEESLFTWQLQRAGFVIRYLPGVVVEHHFPLSRLTRKAMLETAIRAGRSSGYIAHHWAHRRIRNPHYRWARARARLAYWRLRRFGLRTPPDHCPRWEMEMLTDIAYFEQFLRERGRPRHYERFGLRRLDS